MIFWVGVRVWKRVGELQLLDVVVLFSPTYVQNIEMPEHALNTRQVSRNGQGNCPRWAMPIFDQRKQKRMFHISMRRWYPLTSSMWLLNVMPKVRQVYQVNIGQMSKEGYVIEKGNLVVSFHVR